MITTTEVISALTYPEDAFTCIASIASTRCTEIIQLNRDERFENIKALALTDNLKLLRRRLDQVIRLVLCDAHRKEDVVQEYIRGWSEDENVEDIEEVSSSETSELSGSKNDDSSDEANSPPATTGPSTSIRIPNRTGTPSFQPQLFYRSADGNSIRTSHSPTSQDTVTRPAQRTPGSTPERASRPVNATYNPERPLQFRDDRSSASRFLAPPYVVRKRAVSDPNITTPQNPRPKRPKTLQKGGNSAPMLRTGRTTSLQLETPTRTRPRTGPRRMPGCLSDDDGEGETRIVSDDSDATAISNTSSPRPVPIIDPTRNEYVETTATPPEPKTPRAIDDKLRKIIKTDLPSMGQEQGTVYIFRDKDPRRSNLLKIGMTRREMTDRQTGVQRECNIVLEYVYDTLPLSNYGRAEKLAQEELAYFRRPYMCSKPNCVRNHREWFEVSEDLAKRTVKRWTDFMRQNPYGEDRKLKKKWIDKINKMGRPEENEGMNDHDLRWRRWKFVEPPSRLVRLLTHPIWNFFRRFFLHLSCITAWLIVLIEFPSRYTAINFGSHLAIVIVSIFSSLSN
jgi:T5orf172 domain